MASLLLRNIPRTRLNLNLKTSPLSTLFSKSSKHPGNISSFTRLCSVKGPDPPPATLQQKLKKAVAEYGSTVIVFHVSISLISLGACYLVVSSGVDVAHLMGQVGISGERATRIATNAGTFAVAYAVHKLFAPVRLMITLTATPFIVQYLRRVGVLKKSI